MWSIWMYFAPRISPIHCIWTFLKPTNFVYIGEVKFVDFYFWSSLKSCGACSNDYHCFDNVKHHPKSLFWERESLLWRIFIPIAYFVKFLIFNEINTLPLHHEISTGQHLLTSKFFSSNSPESEKYFEYLDRYHITNIRWDTVNSIQIVA